jgi:hypothetical protein
MTYRFEEPIRAEDGVLFRVYDHEQCSYLFKVARQALEQLAAAALKPKNPVDPTNRGYASEQFQKLGRATNRPDHVDIYNQHRDAIHQVAVGLICAGISCDPCIITSEMLMLDVIQR